MLRSVPEEYKFSPGRCPISAFNDSRDSRFGGPRRIDHGPRLNAQIRANQMRLVGEEEQFGVVSREDALKIAEERGLDLVEVSPNADPPVVKLIDYGKFKYWEQKKKAEAKKKTVAADLKEIQFRPNIEKHDLEVKIRKINEILEEGDKVKLVMQFRGREMAHMATGREKFNGLIKNLIETGATVEADAKQMGNRIIAIVAMSGKKKH